VAMGSDGKWAACAGGVNRGPRRQGRRVVGCSFMSSRAHTVLRTRFSYHVDALQNLRTAFGVSIILGTPS
jgi:hypothetical protein